MAEQAQNGVTLIRKHNPYGAGRHTVMTVDVLQKLEAAFANGASDFEACLYADISPSTLYNYQSANPEFVERKAILKETLALSARRNVAKAINDGDGDTSRWYLERKKKDEFSTKTEVEMPRVITKVIIHAPKPKLNASAGTDNRMGQPDGAPASSPDVPTGQGNN